MEEKFIFEDIDYVRVIQGIRYDFVKDIVTIEIMKDGRECEFLTFLTHTSADYPHDHELTKGQKHEVNRYLLTKLMCLGYLTSRKGLSSKDRIVVATDIVDIERGKCGYGGRSGKTLFGNAIGYACKSIIFDGKMFDPIDMYAFAGVDEQTDNIFIDGVDSKFNYGRLDAATSDVLLVCEKHSNLKIFEKTPSIYITANTAPEYIYESMNPRFIPLFFSGYYNEEWTPHDEFGHFLFKDWDYRQWQLFHSLVMDCQRIYNISRSCGLFRFSDGLPTSNTMYVLPF